MDTGSVVTAVSVALIGAAGALLQNRRRSGAREQIKTDIEIYDALPEASTVRSQFLESIDHQIEAMIKRQGELSRDRSGIVVALILLFGGVTTTSIVIRAGGAWEFFLIGTIFLLVMGLFGLSESVPKSLRDEKGNKIQK